MAFRDPFPWFEDRRIEDFWRAFSPFFSQRQLARNAGVFPAVNLYDDGESLMIRAEIPGAKKDSLEVTAQGDQVVIRGERVLEPANPKANYHRREREAGQFRRVVTLSQPIDTGKIQANYKNGVLEVLLPKAAEAKPRKIPVH